MSQISFAKPDFYHDRILVGPQFRIHDAKVFYEFLHFMKTIKNCIS